MGWGTACIHPSGAFPPRSFTSRCWKIRCRLHIARNWIASGPRRRSRPGWCPNYLFRRNSCQGIDGNCISLLQQCTVRHEHLDAHTNETSNETSNELMLTCYWDFLRQDHRRFIDCQTPQSMGVSPETRACDAALMESKANPCGFHGFSRGSYLRRHVGYV